MQQHMLNLLLIINHRQISLVTEHAWPVVHVMPVVPTTALVIHAVSHRQVLCCFSMASRLFRMHVGVMHSGYECLSTLNLVCTLKVE